MTSNAEILVRKTSQNDFILFGLSAALNTLSDENNLLRSSGNVEHVADNPFGSKFCFFQMLARVLLINDDIWHCYVGQVKQL